MSRSRGSDIRAIGIAWPDRVHGIYALPDSGMLTLADLKHKRLGVPVRAKDDVDWWRASVLGGYESLFVGE